MEKYYPKMADEDLQAEIAARLGWRCVRLCGSVGIPVQWAGTRPGREFPEVLPGWCYDLDTAMSLLSNRPRNVMFCIQQNDVNEEWTATLCGLDDVCASYPSSSHRPARAICEAWLLYQDALELERRKGNAR